MEIKCLDPLGINGYEREANEKLEATLPNTWKGYSSLEMRGRQSNEFEGDLILITHDRIINVELKNGLEKYSLTMVNGLCSSQMAEKNTVVMVYGRQGDRLKF